MDNYNGWTNYATWALALWLNNERADYDMFREEARKCLEQAGGDVSKARIALADYIREAVEGRSPLADKASFYADVMSWQSGQLILTKWRRTSWREFKAWDSI